MRRLRTYVSGHRLWSAAVAGVAVLVMGAGIAYGAIGSQSSSAVATSPTTNANAAAPAPAPSLVSRPHRAWRGRLTATSSTALTVQTAAGATVTVEITPATKFGTRAAPILPSSLAIGDEVVVLGTRHGTTVTATRVAKAGKARPAPGPATTAA